MVLLVVAANRQVNIVENSMTSRLVDFVGVIAKVITEVPSELVGIVLSYGIAVEHETVLVLVADANCTICPAVLMELFVVMINIP